MLEKEARREVPPKSSFREECEALGSPILWPKPDQDLECKTGSICMPFLTPGVEGINIIFDWKTGNPWNYLDEKNDCFRLLVRFCNFISYGTLLRLNGSPKPSEIAEWKEYIQTDAYTKRAHVRILEILKALKEGRFKIQVCQGPNRANLYPDQVTVIKSWVIEDSDGLKRELIAD